jgi:hypothetical protein
MKKPYTTMASVLLLMVALAHVLRLAFGWQVTIGDAFIPMWMSAIAAVITATIAVMLWREARK